jgi:hypothetical protein
MREGKIRAELVKRVKHLGGEIRKVQWVARRNAPDELVCLPGRETIPSRMVGDRLIWRTLGRPPRSFFVELKADDLPGEFPRDAHERAQHREHERMRRFGLVVHVVQSLADLDEVLR